MGKAIWTQLLPSIVTLVLMVGCAAPQAVSPPAATATPLPSDKPMGKLSARLDMLATSPDLRAASADEQARALSLPAQGPGSLTRDAQGRVLVTIRVNDVSTRSLQALRDAGVIIGNVSDTYRQVTAFVAVSDLAAIANLSIVMNAQEELVPMNSGGLPGPYPPTR